MMGLLLKDIFNLRKYVKQIGLSLVIFGLLANHLKNPESLIGMMVLMSSMMVITSMSYDEYAKWDKYALTMPILRKDIVLAKYLLLILASVGGAVVSGGIAFVMSAAMQIEKPMETILSSGAIVLVMLFLFSILIPILFKLGVEKARIIMFAVIGVPVFAVAGVVKLMKQFHIPQPGGDQIKLLGYVFPVIVLTALFLSYKISVSIFNKKDL